MNIHFSSERLSQQKSDEVQDRKVQNKLDESSKENMVLINRGLGSQMTRHYGLGMAGQKSSKTLRVVDKSRKGWENALE